MSGQEAVQPATDGRKINFFVVDRHHDVDDRVDSTDEARVS